MKDRLSSDRAAVERRNEGTPAQDAELWQGIARFERATSDEVERHIPFVRRMIELYGYGSALTYEEKLAAGLVGVAVAIEKFDPSRGVKRSYWLSYQIDKAIRNESRLVIRQLKRASLPFDENFDPIDEREWESRSERDEREERGRLSELAVDALEVLDPRSRLVVRRIFFDGATQEEIAKELGVSQSWTSRLARAALRKLRREVERRAAL